MKRTAAYSLALAALFFSCDSFAQKIKWDMGDDLAFLKGQQTVGAEFDYSKITVKGESEKTYVEASSKELNEDKPGEGDAFATEWTAARTKKYQPQFAKGFNKSLVKDGVSIDSMGTAKYTIILTTTDMKLGKGKMFTRKPATVDFDFVIVETANKDKVLAKGHMEEVEGEVNAPKGSAWIPGGGGTAMAMTANIQNRDYSNRIANAYNNAGMAIGKAIHKAL